jgi:hypothetical protein
MTGRSWRLGAAGLTLTLGLGLVSACTAATDAADSFVDSNVKPGSFSLAAFDSCAAAMSGLRAAAKAVVGPYGFNFGGVAYATDVRGGAAEKAGAPMAANAGGGVTGAHDNSSGTGEFGNGYSGTNNQEAGVEEPDLVKTDGHRIVTVSGGVLRVVDAANKEIVGEVNLATDPNNGMRYQPSDLLLSGDHALVLLRGYYGVYAMGGGGMAVDNVAPPAVGAPAPQGAPQPAGDTKAGPVPTAGPPAIAGPTLYLVDLNTPRLLSTYTMDGGLLDARQVGSTARVVLSSSPRLVFPYQQNTTDAKRTAANKKIIDNASIDTWLPRYSSVTGGKTRTGTVACSSVSRPATYTGTNLLTVLTFHLGDSDLGDGMPVSIAADGDSLYGSGSSLYISADQRWRIMPMEAAGKLAVGATSNALTEIYKFDTSTDAAPHFVAGGAVPGYLVNQYAMSELDGKLRVASTLGEPWAAEGVVGKSESSVYVLGQSGRKLTELGHVSGLGKGERIASVRFIGTVGYVVTFRQMDPLYTVDLSDPAAPKVLGELKIPGYSSYLDPAGPNRLLGIGQDANSRGGALGTQISLFDTSDLTNPTRLDAYQIAGGGSTAEYDPHAFLYWPNDRLLVIPLSYSTAVSGGGAPGNSSSGGGSGSGGGTSGSTGSGTVTPGDTGSGTVATGKPAPNGGAVAYPSYQWETGALVLRLDGDHFTKVGFLKHPALQNSPIAIERAFIIGDTLWTASESGLLASDSHTLAGITWISYQ